MSKKLLTLVLSLLLIAAIVYVYYLNPSPVTVRLTSENPVEVPLAIVLIGAFCGGVLLSSIIAFYFGVKQKFELWTLSRQLKQSEAKYDAILVGRSKLRAGNFRAAENSFLKLITKDPDDILSRLLLVETLWEEGDVHAALDALNEFRRERLENLELLFMGADLNAELGNHTAALDNVHLALQQDPGNTYALDRLSRYSEALGRFDDAVSFQRELLTRLSGDAGIVAQERLARLEVAAAQAKFSQDPESFQNALEETLRRHRDCPEALAELGNLALQSGDVEMAVKRWVRAYKGGHDITVLERAVAALLEINKPQRILSILKGITSDKQSITIYPEAHLLTVNVLLHLEMLEDAREHLDKLLDERGELKKHEAVLYVLQSRLMREQGKQTDAFYRISVLADKLCNVPGRRIFTTDETRQPLLPIDDSVSGPEEKPEAKTLGLPGPR